MQVLQAASNSTHKSCSTFCIATCALFVSAERLPQKQTLLLTLIKSRTQFYGSSRCTRRLIAGNPSVLWLLRTSWANNAALVAASQREHAQVLGRDAKLYIHIPPRQWRKFSHVRLTIDEIHIWILLLNVTAPVWPT